MNWNDWANSGREDTKRSRKMVDKRWDSLIEMFDEATSTKGGATKLVEIRDAIHVAVDENNDDPIKQLFSRLAMLAFDEGFLRWAQKYEQDELTGPEDSGKMLP